MFESLDAHQSFNFKAETHICWCVGDLIMLSSLEEQVKLMFSVNVFIPTDRKSKANDALVPSVKSCLYLYVKCYAAFVLF